MKKLSSIISILLVIFTLNFKSVQAASNNIVQEDRIYGKDRYETSIEVSKKGWSKSDYAVIASGAQFPDGLCAAPLSKKYDAPILLTQSNYVSSELIDELERLKVKNVIVVGGMGVVSKNIEESIRKVASIKNVERIGGANRYETSFLIAKIVGNKGDIVLASGKKSADALSIGTVAANENMPILLVDNNIDMLKDYIKSNKIEHTYILGGNSIIPENVDSISPGSERIYGNNRFETNAKILKKFYDKIDFSKIYIANSINKDGEQFADALSSSALAAKNYNPVILTSTVLPDEVLNFIKNNIKNSTTIIALGGEKVVDSTILDKLNDTISQNINANHGGGNSGSESTSHFNIHVDGNNISIEAIAGEDTDMASVVIYDANNQIKYLDQINKTDGKFIFKTVLDSGKYKLKVNNSTAYFLVN